jgi:hydroxymethylglutaryl-CoA synthase
VNGSLLSHVGIVAAGAYVPERRLERAAIAAALGTPAAPGTRAVASYDEDSTTLAVEAARMIVRDLPTELRPRRVLFATSSPAYLEKTNAAAIHAALGLDPAVGAYDVGGATRSGIGALRIGADASEPTLVVTADVRTGLPGGGDEREGGDGAAALLLAPDGPHDHARILGWGTATQELLERWRLPGERAAHLWEERFGEHAYVPVAQAAFADACKASDVGPDELAHVVVTGVHARAVRVVAKTLGLGPEVLVDDLTTTIGNTGTAHPALLLAAVLEGATSGDRIAVLTLADGADAMILEVGDAPATVRARRSVSEQVAAGRGDLAYETFLTWRGMLEREPPRRPDPTAPAAPPSLRHDPWKFAFTGSVCEECGERHLPPARVCARCGAVDRMQPVAMADVPAKVATFTVDRLAFTPSPPLVAAVLDFEGGGRFRCELTDVVPEEVAIGDAVEMTFRRVSTAQSVHNYFWKGRPAPGTGSPRRDGGG